MEDKSNLDNCKSGYGKSRLAEEICKQLNLKPYYKITPKWWTKYKYKYDAHKAVIWNDFRGSHAKFSDLLNILDRYPYTVETKGGERELLADYIIITSTKTPERCYDKEDEDLEQLKRRIDKLIELPNKMGGSQISDVACNIISATSMQLE